MEIDRALYSHKDDKTERKRNEMKIKINRKQIIDRKMERKTENKKSDI